MASRFYLKTLQGEETERHEFRRIEVSRFASEMRRFRYLDVMRMRDLVNKCKIAGK